MHTCLTQRAKPFVVCVHTPSFFVLALRMWNEAPVGVFLFFILLDLFYFLWFLFQPFQHRMAIARKRSRAYCFVLLLGDETTAELLNWKRYNTKQNWLNCYLKKQRNAKNFHFYLVLKILIKILPPCAFTSFHVNNFGLFIIFLSLQFTFKFHIKEAKVIIE